MQKAELELMILSSKSKSNPDYKFNRLYRWLFKEEMFLKAYAKIHNKEGNMTEGTDKTTIDGFNIEKVRKIIELLKQEKYYPNPVLRIYIPKKNGKKRPLGIPSFYDKLVQEVIREILEAIYEPIFSDNSHGFRPNKSCQTALHQIKSNGKGTSWIIEGDIEGFFDNINHEIIINILKRKIDDGRFLELIGRFLKAGYMEDRKKYQTWSGTPQGGIISPILANIYLNELDIYMKNIMEKNNIGIIRRDNVEYRRINSRRFYLRKRGMYAEADECLDKLRKLNRLDMMDPNYRRVKYIRYADDFLVLVWGPKTLAENIKKDIGNFLKDSLKLKLSEEKTLITNIGTNRVKFLGYEISKSKENTKLTEVNGVKKRLTNGTIQLLVPNKVISDKLKMFTSNGKSVHHNARVNLPVLDIISQYNAEIRGLYNYYCLATDVSTKVGKFKYYHYFSLVKTIARKEKTSVAKVIDKYGIDVPRKDSPGTRKVIGVKYKTKNGEKELIYFNESLSKKDKPQKDVLDTIPVVAHRCQLIDRLNSNECELCGKKKDDKTQIEVHHIRKLKDIKDKYSKRGKKIPEWVLTMCRINRKTLILCKDCHIKLHNGSL